MSTIDTWQEAFEQHPIPTTRALEKQFRANITRDKEKLRALVGGNYRDLLATAEAIVSLDSRTKEAEVEVSNIGSHCRPPILESGSRDVSSNHSSIAQLRLLQRCCSVAGVALTNSSTLQCARLVVVARLLSKSLSDQQAGFKSLDSLVNKIVSLRRRLLRLIDSQLASPTVTNSQLTELICAYCLTTSASSVDAFKHTQHLRLEKLRQKLERDIVSSATVIQGLRYQLASLQTLKTLLGRPMSEALSNLQRVAILDDQYLNQIESLDLRGMRKLIPEEIRAFVPYFKRASPTASEADELLVSWSFEATKVLIKGLQQHLSGDVHITNVLALRNDLYNLSLPLYFTIAGGREIQAKLRKSLNDRVEELCQIQAGRLSELGEELVNTSAHTSTLKSMWQPEIAKASVDKGAAVFLHRIKSHHSGVGGDLAKIIKLLHSWISSVKDILAHFEELRIIRWRDVVEEPDDDEEEEVNSLINDLSQNDPRNFSSHLQKRLRLAIIDLDQIFEGKMLESLKEDSLAAENAVALLRAIRESSRLLRTAFPVDSALPKTEAVIPQLHQLIAKEITCRLEAAMNSNSIPSSNTLPENMPSPRAFQTLRKLCDVMSELAGIDIWSRVAVRAIKVAIREKIFTNEHKALYMENEFDGQYLGNALNSSEEGSKSTKIKDGSMKAAAEYWARTRLLFALLASE